MKLELPEIYWHGDKERIMSLDFSQKTINWSPAGRTLRTEQDFWSSGSTFWTKKRKNSLIIWETLKAGTILLLIVWNSPHAKSTSALPLMVCLFNPDRSVIVWELREKFVRFGSDEKEIGWAPMKILHAHSADVYDIRWSSDCKFIVSGSIDNSATVFNVRRGFFC